MNDSDLISRVLMTAVLVLIVTGCDYTAQQGGTVDLRLRSSTELEKAVTTIEYAAVVPTVNGTYKDVFGRTFPNLLDAPATVDLASNPAPLDMLLSRKQVQPGKYNQLRLIFADSALVQRTGKTNKSPRSKLALADESMSTVAIRFESTPLDAKEKRAEITVNLDLRPTSGDETERDSTAAYFEPVVTRTSVATTEGT